MRKKSKLLKARVTKLLLVLAFSISNHVVFSQKADSIEFVNYFGGGATITNNGISLIPTFSLGKPAAIFDMTAGGKRVSFEPQFRFALEGKPWSFVFWWRYKLVKSEKFLINIGAHPAILFRTVSDTTNGVTAETIQGQRYLAGEFSPSYIITKNISVGMYYLTSHGFAESGTKYTHFVTLNTNFSNIKLSEKFYMKFYPQVYYLWMDKNDGFYLNATVTLAKINFPLSIQSILNKIIETNIPGDDFVWNVSLIYAVRHEYVKK